MERIVIGKSGLRASRIGFGTWAIGGWMWADKGINGFFATGAHELADMG